MLKRLAFVLVVGVCVGVAHGKANKIKYFTPEQVQIDESVAALGPDADPDGMALLNYIMGPDKTIVQIMISDMTPLSTYSVRLTDGMPEDDVVVLDALTTDEEGHGTFHQEFSGMDIGTYDVELFVGTTVSGVIWSQVQDAANLPSPTVDTSTDITERAADNFEFGAETTITGIRWWGGWCGATPSIEEFRVRFYDLIVPGVGGSDNFVYEENVFPTSSTSTGNTLPCGAAEFVFEGVLPVAFTAAANTTYWVEVVGIFRDSAVFNVSNASSASGMAEPDGDGAGLQWSFGFSRWLDGFPDRAFELIGETDSTELRATGINPAP